ncbi:MAG: response regulator [Alphaproteobacteria bacterium]|nr:response regulator [Alphaproteobacteria bacterium]
MSVSILVVDDEPDVVDLFKRRFRRELKQGDYAMYFASSGEDALHQLQDGIEPEIMLILSDINMPGMSGFELLKEVKTMWPSLPVAMITAYGDDESRQRATEAGATDFLTKPLDFNDLKSRISEMIAHARS